MKCYTNQTKLQKRVILQNENGDPVTYFLKRGQVVISKDLAVYVDDGVKVTEVQTQSGTKKRSTKNADPSEVDSDSK